MMLYIYERAKIEKPHALVNCSPCHPYFSHICDQARLHDYEPKNRNCLEDLQMRARLFSTAMPGTLDADAARRGRAGSVLPLAHSLLPPHARGFCRYRAGMEGIFREDRRSLPRKRPLKRRNAP